MIAPTLQVAMHALLATYRLAPVPRTTPYRVSERARRRQHHPGASRGRCEMEFHAYGGEYNPGAARGTRTTGGRHHRSDDVEESTPMDLGGSNGGADWYR